MPENLPLAVGAVVLLMIAYVIVRKVTAIMLKMSILTVLLITLAVLAYAYRDQLPL